MMALGPADRETLKALFRACGGHGNEARTGDLARTLQLAHGTVTTRVQALAERGLVEHAPYRGVRLTPAGQRAAVEAIRRHRIVERVLSDMLGYPWQDADRLAVAFEHDLPDEVVARFFVALDRPTTCPHGFPIPAVEAGDLPSLPPLTALEPGDEADVALSGATHPDVIGFLDTLGVRPGVHLVVQDKHPFDGPVIVSVDGRARTIGNTLARQIHVSPTATTATPTRRSPR